MKSRKLYEYFCNEHGTYEDMAYDAKQRKPCPLCGDMNASVYTPVRSWLDGTDPAFPTAWERWAKVHEEKAKQASKAAQEGKEE